MPIHLRATVEEDAEALAACVARVAEERRYLAAVEGFTLAETRTFITSLLSAGGVQIVAIDGDEVVGWCDVIPGRFEGMRHAGSLGMGILESHRGQGLGRRLLRETLRQAFEQGMWRIELEVFASNERAVRLYQSEGFMLEGRKRRARILDGTEDDILIMALCRES